MSDRPALLFYCQHSVGLGHLVRSFALAGALADRFRVVLLCGGAVPEAIAPPAGVELVMLPPLGVGENGAFESQDGRHSVEAARVVRRQMILDAFRAVRPEAVLVELVPFGRAKFASELVPLLEEARARGALVACSLRDILVTGRENQAAHDERACALANRHFDAVLVHSDPRLVRLEESFRLRSRLRVPLIYTGFVRPSGASAGLPRERRIVVSVGGGRVGEALLVTAAEAYRLLGPQAGVRMRMIAGPFLPEAAWGRLTAAARSQDGVELRRSVPDLGAELAAAAASISQCGYNTAIELLGTGVPALVVPYATAEEDEQTERARRLTAIGAVRALDPKLLDAATLAAEARALLGFRPRQSGLDLDGARGSARVLWELTRARAGDAEAAPGGALLRAAGAR